MTTSARGRPGRRLAGRGRHAAAVLLCLCLAAGCVVPATRQWFGVELAPDTEGWEDYLRIEPDAVPLQFRWRHRAVRVEIANWPQDPTYFMVYVRNDADEGARMRVHGVSPGQVGHGTYDVLAPGRPSGGGKLIEDQWIDLPAYGMVYFWIADLPWLDDPAVGDRIDASLDIEQGGTVTTCPLQFHVARVFRSGG